MRCDAEISRRPHLQGEQSVEVFVGAKGDWGWGRGGAFRERALRRGQNGISKGIGVRALRNGEVRESGGIRMASE